MTERSVVDPGVNAGGCCLLLKEPAAKHKKQNQRGLSRLEDEPVFRLCELDHRATWRPPSTMVEALPLSGIQLVSQIHRGNTFELHRALLPDGRMLAMLLATHPTTHTATQRIQRLRQTHDLVASEVVPPILMAGFYQDRPCVIFDRDAVTDGLTIAKHLLARRERLPYEGVIGALLAICSGLEGAHRHKDPETGSPCALGSLPFSSILFGPDGSFWLIGFGDPMLVYEQAALHPLAPELALTNRPSPETDIVALATLMRAALPISDLPPSLRRILGGASVTTDEPIAAIVYGLHRRIWGVPPALRPTLPTLRRAFQGLLRRLEITPDLALFHRSIQDILRSQNTPSLPLPRLRIARDGSWFRIDPGAPVHLTARASLHRVLVCLLDAHVAARPCVSVWQLLEAGWPTQNPSPEAGANRVYAAIASLRRMGLREHIERFDAGYRLHPETQVLSCGPP